MSSEQTLNGKRVADGWGWIVLRLRYDGGGWHPLVHTVRPTRREAIDAVVADMPADWYATERRRGNVRAVRCRLEPALFGIHQTGDAGRTSALPSEQDQVNHG